MKFFRWLRACWGGYFWLPCPLCGENFGGYEVTDARLRTSRYESVSICPRCADKARKLNEKNKKEHMKETPMIIDVATHMGIENKECPICEGEGVVLGEGEYDHDGMLIQNYGDCLNCKGTGQVK